MSHQAVLREGHGGSMLEPRRRAAPARRTGPQGNPPWEAKWDGQVEPCAASTPRRRKSQFAACGSKATRGVPA